MKFEYDLNKSLSNKEKHGVDFEQAKEIWFNDHVIFPAMTKGEPRYMIIGKIGLNIYSCIFTMRDVNVRMISCRKSRDMEREVYHEKVI